MVGRCMESRPMWHQLGPPARRQSPVRALCSVILGFTLLAATLALVLSWLLATGILDPGAPARAQAARKLDLTRLPEPTNDLERLPKPTELPASTSAPTTASPAATTTTFDPLPSCQAPGFLCTDGLTCVGPAQVCDGISDCPQHEESEGGEDEEGCSGSGGGQPDELILASPILVALTSRPEVSTERQVEEEGGSDILEEETKNVLSEVLRVVDETRRRLEETKDSTDGDVTSREEATTEAATFTNPSEVTKEVDNLVASTAKEEEGTQVTGEGSAGSTKPTEVWTLRPNWSTVGSTLQEEEETTIKVLTTIGDATEFTSSPTEQVPTIGESVTTEAVETAAENITQAVTETVKAEDIVNPAVTETVPLIDATSLLIESASVTEESSTQSTIADLTTTTSAPTPAATTTVFEPSPSCQAPDFLCKDGLTCVGPAQVCDGISDCPQHEEGEG